MAASTAAITRQRAIVSDREEAVRMRRQQDEEYEASLLVDRRERERREQQEQEEQQAEQARLQEEELAAAMALSERLTAEDTLRKRRSRLAPEPETSATTAIVRFQLPRGKKMTRRFEKTDSARTLYDFLAVYFADQQNEEHKITNFSVSTHFPKQEVLDNEEDTVDSLQLFPRGMLYVVDSDA